MQGLGSQMFCTHNEPPNKLLGAKRKWPHNMVLPSMVYDCADDSADR